LANGHFDSIYISGRATVEGEIRFVLDGFAPQAGDQIDFLTATQGVSLDPTVALSVVGVEPGFQFQVTTVESNTLRFTALNSGIPVPEASMPTMFLTAIGPLIILRKFFT
jgi:hypothetical protein